ncbi:hypothetical protein LCGC14_0320850 [marine sediment metagenome]|uniref:SDR family oxidoreductase n=1 Tax=marine sediment metagenome TaxID=412755 RepID=A0A0F9WRG6_9ZZZZ
MTVKENFMEWKNLGTALVTGASSGIGEAFARELASQGFDLILVARRKNRLDNLSKELHEKYSIKAEVFVADLSNIDDDEKIVARIQKSDNLDVLINNAGFGISGTFLKIDLKRHIDMINVHITSPIMFCHAALPGMIKRKKGVIINTSSLGAIILSPLDFTMYTPTKAAITIFSEQLKEEIKNKAGVYIQCLCPGETETEIHSKAHKDFRRDMIPEEYWMSPEDCVSMSLEAVKTGEVIFIPGEFNIQWGIRDRKESLDRYLEAKKM